MIVSLVILLFFFFSSWSAPLTLAALSNRSVDEFPCRFIDPFNAFINDSAAQLVTSSKWVAFVAKQMKSTI